ncbi:MAG: EamA family transporter [bacterium]|nr:EamA family transporter [bacterium]
MRKLQLFQPVGLWLVVGAAALWGTIGVATQGIYHSDHTTPLFINLTRMLIAAPVLVVACWRIMGARMFQIQPRHGLILFLNGTFLAISQAAYFAAIQAIGITIATLLTICIAPLLVTALAVLLRLEPLTGRNLAALSFGIIGSVLLVGFHPQESAAYNLPLGVVYSLVATV